MVVGNGTAVDVGELDAGKATGAVETGEEVALGSAFVSLEVGCNG